LDRFRRHLHPEYTTPQERLDRVIEILAGAAVRWANERAGLISSQDSSLDGVAEGKVPSEPDDQHNPTATDPQ
jgi:hypothetical protein